ncbi:bifunctional diguanylate cyclase/phosphodiesterase [Clostridium transplantifaecale]|uniref:bifunctional diguanylate cyclase/phosphodiesterase n=1 Tax=Clostridium transplantifaecale TaxID=2479838 RepID=UPI001FAA4F13|nr:GGDEF domain-containing phosphodiesterase [Clostridium transplantifaecale]
MKKSRKPKKFLYAAVSAVLLIAFMLGRMAGRGVVSERRQAAENILFYYGKNTMLQLQGGLNEAHTPAQIVRAAERDRAGIFEREVKPLLQREEVVFAGLFAGDTLVSSLPEEQYGHLKGNDLKDFSYAYTMAKVVKNLVVDGPVNMEYGGEQRRVFLFLEPFAENNAYLGEVAIALDADYVLDRLGLKDLEAQGYDYELWRVEPQNGEKEVVAATEKSIDFSKAIQTTFYLPGEWTLSIQPAGGWISLKQRIGFFGISAAVALVLLTVLYTCSRLAAGRKREVQRTYIDAQTGLYSRTGFTEALDQWLAGDFPVNLYYYVFQEYTRFFQLAGPAEENDFLHGILPRLEGYIKNQFIAGRLGAGNFIVAVRDDMDENEQKDFARGLSLELMLKTRVAGEKKFLTAGYQHTACRPGERTAEDEINLLIHDYYDCLSKESPARMLTEKCQQLIEGQRDISFDEYTDSEMTELSRTFNQYRKQVEQLAYFDPVFNVGNRSKFLRDVNILISYDKKRAFTLYCVDICGFSQYNELFSVDVGDEILLEVLRRMSRLFGSYLYRINGDVFLGLLQSDESMESSTERLKQTLSKPILVGELSFLLKLRTVACKYPDHGDAPKLLLDRVQSGMRFAKESQQDAVIYNEQLNELLRTEAEILHRLEAAIRENMLEIWYQPMMRLETGFYDSVEALVRLPDGKGGYFPANQVVILAERNNRVEQLGDYVLTKACCFMRDYGEKLGLHHIHVNLSVQQLLVGNSAEHILQLIHSTGVGPNQIILEITESILIQSLDSASETLKKFRKEGIGIALDDFGVGYSSLNYLSNLPVDVIKIDRSLTQQICSNPKQYALLKAIVKMAEINSLTVVAEGVENEAEQKLISDSGVQYIQGYYYERPVRGEELIHLLS